MPTPTAKLGIPEPLDTEIVSRAAFNAIFDQIDAAAAAQTQVDQPFHLDSAVYNAGSSPPRLELTTASGRARFGATLARQTGQVVTYVNNPTFSTTYYLYIKSDGTYLVNTTGAETAGAILLHSVATGASPGGLSTLTLTDLRAQIGGSAAAQVHYHDGVVTPVVAMLNNYFATGQDAGAVARTLIGLNGSSQTLVGDPNSPGAMRVRGGSGQYVALEVGSTEVGRLTTTVMTLVGGLTVAGAITGATTVAGTLTTAAQPNVTSLGTLTGLGVAGNISATGSVSGATIVGTLTTAAQPNVTSLGTLTGLSVAGAINATGAVAGATLGGTLTTAAQPNVTSLGTLTSLSVSGAVSVGSLTSTGTLAGTNLTLSGTISAGGITGSTLTGTLLTAAQPNVTSLGTLTGLSVGGNVSATGSVTGSTLVGTLTTAAQPNVTSLGTLTTLNVGVGGISTSGNISATGNLSAANLTGTLQTAAQPNVTSLGTLAALAVTTGGTASIQTTSTGATTAALDILNNHGGFGVAVSIQDPVLSANAAVYATCVLTVLGGATSAVAALAGENFGIALNCAAGVDFIRLTGGDFTGAAIGSYAGKFAINVNNTRYWVPYYN